MVGRKQFDVEHALDAAVDVFWVHGYSEASLQRLTEATGLGRGSLYGTFGDKDNLFRRCLARYGERYSKDFRTALEAEDVVAAIDGFFMSILRRMRDPNVPDGCLVAQSAAAANGLAPDSKSVVVAMLDEQRRAVRSRRARAGMDGPAAKHLAEYVVAVRQSLAVLNRSGSSDAELRRIAKLATDTVASALMEARPLG